MRLIPWFLGWFICLELQASALYPGEHFDSFGMIALERGKKSQAYGDLSVIAVDGTIELPPHVTDYDRRVGEKIQVGGRALITPQFLLGANGAMTRIKRKQEEKNPPKTPITEERSLSEASLELLFVNPKGLEMTLAIRQLQQSPYEVNADSPITPSKTSVSGMNLKQYRLAIIRPFGGKGGGGGFYYDIASDVGYNFHKTAADGSEVHGTFEYLLPSVYGILAKLPMGLMTLDLDFSAVQAGSGGERSEDGVTVNDDYLVFLLGAQAPLGILTGQMEIRHQTLSYSNNAFVMLETIPVTSLRLKAIMGSEESHIDLACVYTYGKDRQSIPEFNATYTVKVMVLETGLTMSF